MMPKASNVFGRRNLVLAEGLKSRNKNRGPTQLRKREPGPGPMEERMLRRLLSFPYQLCLIVLFILLGVSCPFGPTLASLFPNGEDRAQNYIIYWARISLRLARLEITVAGLDAWGI